MFSKYWVRFWMFFICQGISLGMLFGQDLEQLKDQKPYQLNGSIALGGSFYQARDISARRQPFNWYLSGSPVLSVYGITIPFSLVISDQDRRFSQPFNQYGVSPYYKWITVHAGYRNLRFSEFTMNAVNFLGGGLELKPGKWRVGLMYGRLNRAVAEDSIMGASQYGYIRPVYRRMGYAAKLGYGTSAKYVDLLVFKAKDDTNSIAPVSLASQVEPEENLAVGIKSQLGFLKNRLMVDLDAGASFLTRDLRKGSLLDSANNPSLRTISKYISVNGSSGFFTGLQTSVGYHAGFAQIKAVYRRVDPGYRSLGAYFFQNDIEQITINSSFQVWQNKLAFNLSYGHSSDNLNKKRFATTNRQVYSANVNWLASSKVNVNLDYSNFGISQQKGIGDLFNDTTAMSVINSNVGLALTYKPLQSEVQSHQFSFSSYLQSTNDLNRFTEEFSEAKTWISSLSYQWSLVPQKLNATASLSYNKTDLIDREIVNISPSIYISKLFLKDKLRATLSENLQIRESNREQDGYTSTTALTLAYRWKRHTFSYMGSYLANQYKATSMGYGISEFSEMRSNLSYSISF